MGYMHITNLYRPEAQVILDLRRVYAMEKVHGTSAHISYDAEQGDRLHFSSGGSSHASFTAIFDQPALLAAFAALGHPKVVVFGEAYGGKQQGMSKTYGPNLCFIVFEVKIGDSWLSVPNAHDVSNKLGLEFVPYELVDCTLSTLDQERDRPSIVAERRGMGTDKKREGIVIRPTVELWLANGERLMAKHKGEEFQERQNQPAPDVDPTKRVVLEAAQAIADEWVTPMRLEHVLDKLPDATDMKHTPIVIKAMVEDVYREAAGEVIESKEATAAIGKKAAALFKAHVQTKFRVGKGDTHDQ